MATAIVTGATGINGRAIVKALAADPTTWKDVYAVSRSVKEPYPPHVHHVALDLLGDAAKVASQLTSAVARRDDAPLYVFLAAYVATGDDQKDWDANGAMVRNVLQGLRDAGLEPRLRRVVLTTGAKYYGVQLGPVPLPMVESDPRVQAGRPPNFYYHQEDVVQELSRDASWDWVVCMPNDIVGFARGNFMNAALTFALYAVVTRELGRELYFPGSEALYVGWDNHSYAPLIADFEIWAARTEACGRQYFNVVNGEPATWQRNWPKMARRFGATLPAAQFEQTLPLSSETPLDRNPPAAERMAEFGLAGSKEARRRFLEQSRLQNQVTLVKWSQQPEVRAAWERVAEREGLVKEAFEQATWGFLDFMIGRSYDIVISMNKARKFGWTGFIDDWEGYEKVFDELEKEKIIPKSESPGAAQ